MNMKVPTGMIRKINDTQKSPYHDKVPTTEELVFASIRNVFGRKDKTNKCLYWIIITAFISTDIVNRVLVLVILVSM